MKKKVTVQAVPANMINIIWDKCLPHIDVIIKTAPTEFCVDGIKERLLNADFLLVTVSDGADIIAVNILEISVYMTGLRVMTVLATATAVKKHRLHEWLQQLIDLTNALALDYNCTEMRAAAVRDGWFKVLKRLNYKKVFTSMRCDVKQQ